MRFLSKVLTLFDRAQVALAYALMAPILAVVTRIEQLATEETEAHLAELEAKSPEAAAKARDAVRQLKGGDEGFLLPFSDVSSANSPSPTRKPGRPKKLPSPPAP